MPHPTVVEFIDAIRSRSSSVVLVGSGFVEFADVVHEGGSYVDVILADHLGRITYYQGGFADYEIIGSDGEQLVWEHIERIDEIEQLVERFNKLCSAVNAYAQARAI